jgi:hypothetical protein
VDFPTDWTIFVQIRPFSASQIWAATYQPRTNHVDGHVDGHVVTQIWDAEKGRSLRFSKVRLADIFAVKIDISVRQLV